ncbi:MAG: T9SS type A sorting domain-containing protein [Bacteroidales bacterium]|nr:T9SS type A sorting domain-containing protein [Bacteroidales bacterium]
MKTTAYIQKNLILTITALMIITGVKGQFIWDQACAYGSHGTDMGKCIATDILNTVYVAGEYQELLLDQNSNVLLPPLAQGCNDIFIFRYDMNGNLMMAKNLENPWWGPTSPYCTDKQINGMASGEPDGLYITGSFSNGICLFDPLSAVNTDDGSDFYIARMEPNSGHCMWVRTAYQNPSPFFYDAKGTAITADKAGNIYVTGSFTNHIVFGNVVGFVPSITPNFVTLNALNQDVFVARYDMAGNCIWVKQIKGNAGSYYNYGHSITTDNEGNIYVTGSFQTSATFGNITLTSTGVDDMFLAKYDPQGNCLWARNEGGHCHNSGHSVAVNDANQVFVTGFFQGTDKFGHKTLTSAGAADIFLAKYEPYGRCVNAIRFGNANDDWGVSVKIRQDRLWLMGAYSQSITIGYKTLFSGGDPEHFIAEFIMGGLNLHDADNIVQSKTGTVTAVDLALNPQGDVFVTGNYNGSGVIFPHSLPPSAGNTVDVFFGKIAFWNTKSAIAENAAANTDTVPALSVYPNPSADMIRLNFDNKNQNQLEVEVRDAAGRPVFRYSTQESLNGFILSREQLGGAGIYFCTILSNNSVLAQEKFIFIK